MNFSNNPPRRTALIWGGVGVVGIIVMFIPWMTGMDGFDGGYALGCLGGFILMAGIIAAVVYLRLGTALDAIVTKKNILAHWTYTPEQWRDYTEQEHKEDRAAKRGLFIMIAVIAVVIGIIFGVVERADPWLMVFIVLGIIALAGLSAFFSTYGAYWNNKRRLGEATISRDGVYLNRQVHIWKGIGNRLEYVAYENEHRAQPVLCFEYSSPGKGGRNSYTARVPVPPGQEEKAKEIAAEIARIHLKN